MLNEIRKYLVWALALAVFVEFAFVAAIAATLGAFSGGSPTHAPPLAVAYLFVSLGVTVVVIVRIRRLIAAADRGDVDMLRRLMSGTFVLVAYLFSAFLPAIMLASARTGIRRLR